jgi:hypothetical protein
MYRKALKTAPDRARGAMRAEVKRILDKKLFHPTLFKSLSYDERKLTINYLGSFKGKFKANGDFEKSKGRILIKSDFSGAVKHLIGEQRGAGCTEEGVMAGSAAGHGSE